jgi:hypothetical protein
MFVSPLASNVVGQIDANYPIQGVPCRVTGSGDCDGVCRPDETESLDTDSPKLVTSLNDFPPASISAIIGMQRPQRQRCDSFDAKLRDQNQFLMTFCLRAGIAGVGFG